MGIFAKIRRNFPFSSSPYCIYSNPDVNMYMASHLKTGNEGETLAAAYFTEMGYQLLHRNWRCGKSEIDIIASRSGTIHFIEVKTRTSFVFGFPEEKADKKKLKNMIDGSVEFLRRNPQWKKVQFDVLAINLDETSSPKFFLIEDVYL